MKKKREPEFSTEVFGFVIIYYLLSLNRIRDFRISI